MPDILMEKQGTGKWPWRHLRDTNVDSDCYQVLAYQWAPQLAKSGLAPVH